MLTGRSTTILKLTSGQELHIGSNSPLTTSASDRIELEQLIEHLYCVLSELRGAKLIHEKLHAWEEAAQLAIAQLQPHWTLTRVVHAIGLQITDSTTSVPTIYLVPPGSTHPPALSISSNFAPLSPTWPTSEETSKSPCGEECSESLNTLSKEKL